MKKFILLSLTLILFSACRKEEIINQLITPDYNNDGEYVLEPIPGVLGNVKISLWPSYNGSESKIQLENRLDKPVGFIIRDLHDQSFVYFSDAYISAKKN